MKDFMIYRYTFTILFLLSTVTLFGKQAAWVMGPAPEARVFSFVELKDTKGLARFLSSEQGALNNFATKSLNFQRSFDGNTPLFRAAATNNPAMVLLLREYGADPNVFGTIFYGKKVQLQQPINLQRLISILILL
jgi:hypothetical protein